MLVRSDLLQYHRDPLPPRMRHSAHSQALLAHPRRGEAHRCEHRQASRAIAIDPPSLPQQDRLKKRGRDKLGGVAWAVLSALSGLLRPRQ
jgi:hypothetical protein